jgi:hypothetical protein
MAFATSVQVGDHRPRVDGAEFQVRGHPAAGPEPSVEERREDLLRAAVVLGEPARRHQIR